MVGVWPSISRPNFLANHGLVPGPVKRAGLVAGVKMSANCLTRGEMVKQTENIFKFGFPAGNKSRDTTLLRIPSLIVAREDIEYEVCTWAFVNNSYPTLQQTRITSDFYGQSFVEGIHTPRITI